MGRAGTAIHPAARLGDRYRRIGGNLIEQAVTKTPGLAFDLAKALVESVCRTILSERSIAFDPSDNLPKLFKAVTTRLPFLPVAASQEAGIRKSLAQTVSALYTLVQGICELRNQCTVASHGAAGPRPAMEPPQALLAAQTADAIIGFLYRIHVQDRAPKAASAEYDANAAFNNYVDENHGLIRVFEADFKPSEVLFVMEPETYRVHLAEFEPDGEGEESGLPAEDAAEAAP